MEDQTTVVLRETLDTLKARRAALAADLTRIDAAVAALSQLVAPSIVDELKARSDFTSRQRRSGGGVIKPAIERILRAHAPNAIHADQVVEELRQQGIPLSARDPKATAVTAMIRMAQARDAAGAAEGVDRLGGNRFRWAEEIEDITASLPPLRPSVPQPPASQSLDAPQESAPQLALSRP